MNYAEIKYCDIANGPGVRTSLFVSGCRHACPGCFNQQAQAFEYGRPFTQVVQEQIIQSCRADYVTGITLLGGEPMQPQNQRALLPFLRGFRQALPEKTVWCYTGCIYEQLADNSTAPDNYRCEVTQELLSLIDVLVDGPFVQHLHDITLRFRGSSNQRLIDLNKTRIGDNVEIWTDGKLFSDHSTMDPRA